MFCCCFDWLCGLFVALLICEFMVMLDDYIVWVICWLLCGCVMIGLIVAFGLRLSFSIVMGALLLL